MTAYPPSAAVTGSKLSCRLRAWLIRKIAGRAVVLLNAEVSIVPSAYSLEIRGQHPADHTPVVVYGNTFIESDGFAVQLGPAREARS